VIFFFVAILLP